MIELIVKIIYLLLPAYFANASATVTAKIPWLKELNQPIDFNLRLGKNYLFGPHKTYRGLISGVLLGIITVWLQKLLFHYPIFEKLSLIDYQQINVLYFGLLAGLGALGGDLVGGFIKRRLNFQSGQSLPILDQLNFIIGFFILTSLVVKFDWLIILIASVITLIIHPLTNLIAYLLKIKKVWW